MPDTMRFPFLFGNEAKRLMNKNAEPGIETSVAFARLVTLQAELCFL